jgi:hypothetical protein
MLYREFTMKVLDKKTTKVYTFEDKWGVWYFDITETKVIVTTGNINSDAILFVEDLDVTKIIFDYNTVISSLEYWWNEKNREIHESWEDVSFALFNEEDNETINQGIEHLKVDIATKIMNAYVEKQPFNINIIIEKSGEIRTHNYYGSVDYRDDDIVWVHTVRPENSRDYYSMMREGLSQEEIEMCDENNWVTVWEGSNDEFVPTYDEFIEAAENIIERFNNEVRYKSI